MPQIRRHARPSIFAVAATLLTFSPSSTLLRASAPRQILVQVEASSPPYNAYQYDLTTPRFTPDGRLLQVEYASRAPEQSGPLVAVPVWSDGGDDDGSGGHSVVIASIAARSPLSKDDASKDEDDTSGNGKKVRALMKSKRRRKGQSRLLSLPLGPTVSTGGAASSPNRSIVVGLSGILADATSLLEILQDDLTQYRSMYGLGKLHAVLPNDSAEDNGRGPGEALATSTSSALAAPTVVARRVAREVGRRCQTNSFGGGIRPFGASIAICGVDESGICICITQPCGAVRQVVAFDTPMRKCSVMDNDDGGESKTEDETGDGNKPSDDAIIIGVDATVQRRLREQLANKLSPDGSLRSTVDGIVTSLLEVQGYIDDDSSIARESFSLDNDITDLEIVIARSDGSYKLTSAEVGAIIERVIRSRSR